MSERENKVTSLKGKTIAAIKFRGDTLEFFDKAGHRLFMVSNPDNLFDGDGNWFVDVLERELK